MIPRLALLALLALAGLPAAAQGQGTDPDGSLNPVEMGMSRVMEDIRRGRTGMTHCAAGYLIHKSGRHGMAREVFEACAGDGYTGAMTWMSHLDNNGLGGARDPEAAAEWSRRAAEAGDPVAQFNHGLDLLRGHGVARDRERGRAMIDAAARAGNRLAERLRGAGYDPDAVTPDADSWRYAPVS